MDGDDTIKCLAQPIEHSDIALTIDVNANRTKAVSSGIDGRVKIWDVEDFISVHTYKGRRLNVRRANPNEDVYRPFQVCAKHSMPPVQPTRVPHCITRLQADVMGHSWVFFAYPSTHLHLLNFDFMAGGTRSRSNMPPFSGTPLAPAATTSPVSLHSTPTLDSETFALFFIEALRDKSVIAALYEANKSNANEIADMVILKLGTRVKDLEEELKSTKKELKEEEADDQEQYSRRTSIRITGLPENNDENVSDLVNDLFKTVNINPVINRVHRVGPKDQNKNRSRQVLCQFTTYPDKYQVMIRKKAIRGSHPSVFICEDLTRTRSRIAYLAREKKRQKKVADVWTADGRGCVKDNAGKSLDKILDNLKNYNSPCYVMGDFNLDLLNSDTHPTVFNEIKYKKYKTVCRDVVNFAKKSYYEQQCLDNCKNIKQALKILKEIIVVPNKTTISISFLINDKIEINKIKIADYFNEYFVNVGLELASKIPQTTSCLIDKLPGNYVNSFYLNPINENVSGAIIKLKIGSPGHDQISPIVVKNHQLCFMRFNVKNLNLNNKYITIKNRPHNLHELIETDLQNMNIMQQMDHNPDTDPSHNYTIIHNAISSTIDKHTTTKTVKFNKHKHKKSEWRTQGLIRSIRYRDKLHLKMKRTHPDSPQRNTLKTNIATYNKILKKTIRQAKALHYNNIFRQAHNNPKDTWKAINNTLNRNTKTDTNIEYLIDNDRKITAPKEIADHLNTFFTNIGHKIAS
ncbi:hypothetical protein CAPTEDRAFT_206882 [Capitella teleta]|uniref:Uncharacterized protein n=1 Tax=Capitella teleta TaxID=283909 RepID=R7UMU4_CAPTE|nr:hypothetical protein CAPTEDRAFT_206882 [Capitella teleta]|eukprot:ELU05252.1 hypothetical protein CAPTEDRAFT_206882 [Capitella teleta]